MTQHHATRNYEVDRQRHLHALIARLPGEVEKMTWPLERLHALRDERLRALVRTAQQHSPWHAQRLRHIDPDTLRGDDLSMIPPMTKADLMTNWDDIVTDRRLTLALANAHLERIVVEGPAYLLDDYHVVASGGSSGLRGVFVWDFQAWLLAHLLFPRHQQWLAQHLPLPPIQRIASVLAGSPAHISISQRMTFRRPGEFERSFPVTRPLAENVAGLNEFRPDAIGSYPSVLHRLALEAREGRLQITPHILVSSAEPLTAEKRRTIEAVFDVPLIDLYGASETAFSAVSYPGAAALHLIEDVAVYEPVDQDNQPVPPGTPGAKLLMTNVINQVLPLIRYELADEITILDEPDPNPWTGRRIAAVHTHPVDVFVYSGGVMVHPDSFIPALEQLPDVSTYQIRQTPRGADIVLQTTQQLDLDPVQQKLVAALRQVGLADPEISITTVAEIERIGGTGKLRWYVPYRALAEG
jgi:phenylacetate-coenzyme A ligase PaaK-like adenylate-forming protein